MARFVKSQAMNDLGIQSKLEALVRVGVALSSIESLDDLLERIVEEAMALTAADGASLYLRKAEMLEFHTSRNHTLEARLGPVAVKELFGRFEIPVDESIQVEEKPAKKREKKADKPAEEQAE